MRYTPYLATAFAALALPVLAQRADDAPTPMAAPTAAVVMQTVAEPGVTVTGITVEGTERLEDATVLSYLRVTQGQEVTQEKLSDALKALYASGLFKNVTLRMDGARLVVSVEENPIVNQIVFEGNEAIDREDLERELQLKSRLVYTPAKAQRDAARLLEVYRRSGRFAAKVDPKVVALDQNRVDLVFEIQEGDKTGVAKINFIGNTHFDDGDLRSVVATSESAWWKFLSTSDFYDPDRVAYDRELLRRFYANEGFVDAKVTASSAELAPGGEDFFITYTVDEGPRYKVGSVKLVSSVKDLDTTPLEKEVTLEAGEWYSAEGLEKTINGLTNELGNQQYAFVDIAPSLQRKKDDGVVDVTLNLKDGQRVFVNRVEIAGNMRTLDKVVRREMLLAEGDPFNQTKLRRSEQKIKDLGYFETVTVVAEPSALPDQTDIKVDLKEKATGEISFGAGFSSTDGVLGDFAIRERNFLGHGQDVRVGATLSGRTQQYDFSFTEPYFLNRDLTAGVDVFRVTRDNQDESSYDETNTGGSLRFGYPLSEQLRQRWNYTLQNTEISDVPASASRFIREQEGDTITSLVGQELTYDTRDSRLDPTQGLMSRISTDLAGLGGDVNYARVRALATAYVSLAEKWVMQFLGEGGQIVPFAGDRIRISDRFFIGGDTLRGFQFAGIGPRDLTNGVDDALGGERFVRGSAELTLPSGLPNEVGLKFHAFTDVGVLGDLDATPLPGEIFKNEESLRMSAGFGATWSSPFGPLRLDVARALIKESYDKTETFRFSFGTRF